MMNNSITKEIESQSKVIWNYARAAIMIVDADTHKIYDLNDLATEMIGIPKEQIIGQICHKFICPAAVGKCPITDLGQTVDNSERVLLKADGAVIPILKSVTTVILNGRRYLIETFVDISKRKKIERESENVKRFLQTIIDGIDESIMVIGTDYKVQMLNRSARESLLRGSSLSEPMTCYHLSHHRTEPCEGIEEPCPLQLVLKTKQSTVVTHKHVAADGHISVFEIVASPLLDQTGEVIQIIETSRDITNRLMLEEEKRRLDERIYIEQKEQSIITLAGGIAHDFNNILMGVLGNAELLQMEFPPLSKHRELTENIIVAAERMAHLTKQLLAYAKVGTHQPSIISINSSIEDALNLAHKGKSLDIEIALELSQDLLPVLADPGQIMQVFVNLFTNAFESMEGGGRFFIQTYNAINKDSWVCPFWLHEHPAGDYVHIRISDTGPGIPKEIQKRIFEPFFTTKFLGRGLGLSAVLGIIYRHGGCISMESEVGTGTVFDIYLPCAKEIAEERKQEIVHAEKEMRGNKILIVDDEPMILSLLEDMLVEMGYEVLSAINGEKALEIFQREKNAIGLSILDIQIPDIDGKRLFKEFKAIKPDIKVLISTGYDKKTATEEIESCHPDGFIQKPYKSKVLKEKISEILKK